MGHPLTGFRCPQCRLTTYAWSTLSQTVCDACLPAEPVPEPFSDECPECFSGGEHYSWCSHCGPLVSSETLPGTCTTCGGIIPGTTLKPQRNAMDALVCVACIGGLVVWGILAAVGIVTIAKAVLR